MWIAMMVAVGFFPLMQAALMSRSNLANSSISVMETLAFASFHRNSQKPWICKVVGLLCIRKVKYSMTLL